MVVPLAVETATAPAETPAPTVKVPEVPIFASTLFTQAVLPSPHPVDPTAHVPFPPAQLSAVESEVAVPRIVKSVVPVPSHRVVPPDAVEPYPARRNVTVWPLLTAKEEMLKSDVPEVALAFEVLIPVKAPSCVEVEKLSKL